MIFLKRRRTFRISELDGTIFSAYRIRVIFNENDTVARQNYRFALLKSIFRKRGKLFYQHHLFT